MAHDVEKHEEHLDEGASAGEHVVKRVDVGGERVLIELESLHELHHLSRQRRRVVGNTLDSLASLLLGSALEKELSARQLEERGRIAIDTVRLLVESGPERLEALISALEEHEIGPVEATSEDVEARARMRFHALYQSVVRDSYSVADLAARMGVSRQRLKQLRDQDRLFAIEVPFRRGWLYPRWQFEIESGKPRHEMPTLLAAARDGGLDAVGFHVMMTSPEAGAGVEPLALLEAGEEDAVIQILRGANQ